MPQVEAECDVVQPDTLQVSTCGADPRPKLDPRTRATRWRLVMSMANRLMEQTLDNALAASTMFFLITYPNHRIQSVDD